MIDREIQKIISPFGMRTLDGVKQDHKGVDLRSWNLTKMKRQAVIFPERCQVLRIWTDKNGGGVAYKGLDSDLEFKSIHIKLSDEIIVDGVYEPGEVIGYSMSVQGMKEHEHFETWQNGKPIDPCLYFDEKGIRYE
jgi:hypothetical protein